MSQAIKLSKTKTDRTPLFLPHCAANKHIKVIVFKPDIIAKNAVFSLEFMLQTPTIPYMILMELVHE